MAKVLVPSNSYEEEFIWSLAWMLASFEEADNKDESNKSLDEYKPKADYIGFLFATEDDEEHGEKGAVYKRLRTLAFVYEWMLMGHETSRICFQRFMEARLS